MVDWLGVISNNDKNACDEGTPAGEVSHAITERFFWLESEILGKLIQVRDFSKL